MNTSARAISGLKLILTIEELSEYLAVPVRWAYLYCHPPWRLFPVGITPPG